MKDKEKSKRIYFKTALLSLVAMASVVLCLSIIPFALRGEISVAETITTEQGEIATAETQPQQVTAEFIYTYMSSSGEATITLPNHLTYSNTNKDIAPKFTLSNGEEVKPSYKISYYQKSEPNTPLAKAPRSAGEYFVKVEVTDSAYSISEKNQTADMTIDKYPLTLTTLLISGSEFYDGREKTVTLRFETSGLPDQDAYKLSYFTADGTPLSQAPKNVGKYCVEPVFSNNNYVVKTETSGSGKLYYEILPKTLSAKFTLPSSLIYDKTAKNVTVQLDGIVEPDFVKIDIAYSKDNTAVLPENVVDIGVYKVSLSTPNLNYLIKDTIEFTIAPIVAEVKYTIPTDLVYTGEPKVVGIALDGILTADDVSVSVEYNGQKTPPIGAGQYEISYVLQGVDLKNYSISTKGFAMIIQKADYPFDTLQVEISNIKIIVVNNDFGTLKVSYSLDGAVWQDSNELIAKPMATYTVQAKLHGDDNHNEKILTADCATGFDKTVFNDTLNTLNPNEFTFADVPTYLQLVEWLKYVKGDEAGYIDQAKFDELTASYNKLMDSANATLKDSFVVANRLQGKNLYPFMVNASAVVFAIAVIRRRLI